MRQIAVTSAMIGGLAGILAIGAAALATPPAGAELPTRDYSFVAKDVVTIERLREFVGLQQSPPKVPGASYRGDDSCVYANDMECDDPGIGTGACRAGTDYSDCWRIATGAEDDSCRWANDGECDEPQFGFGVCTQGTDRTDCGEVAHLRFQTDTCELAFNGVCNEPGTGDGACAAQTDRTDCIGRERPMQIADHFGGYDDRVLLDRSAFPWAAIGWIDLADASCTATLIGPDILLTAAHCIETDRNVIDANGTFETAVGSTGRGLTARITAYLVADNRGRPDGQDSDTDWALLRIDQRLGDQIGYLGIRSLQGSSYEQLALMPLYQAGYSWDTGFNLSGHLGCTILAVDPSDILRHNCDTTHGDSGSPLMVEEDGVYVIVATDSAFDLDGDGPVGNVATMVSAWELLLADFSAGRIGLDVGVTGGKGPGKAWMVN